MTRVFHLELQIFKLPDFISHASYVQASQGSTKIYKLEN